MKTIANWFLFLLTAAVLAGCATTDSSQTSRTTPTVSGYVDTSAQTHH